MRIIRYIIIALLFLMPFAGGPVHAESIEETDSRIEELRQKIRELQGKETSLKKEISTLDYEISINSLKIENTQRNLDKIASELGVIDDRLVDLTGALEMWSELFIRRVPQSYKRQYVEKIDYILLSSSFSDFISRIKYLSLIQSRDLDQLENIKRLQINYNRQKETRETKQAEQEILKAQLQKQMNDLAVTKRTKQTLLEQTKNSENEYQRLLAQALAEKQALERALVEGVQVGPVKRGDPIALVGNTGYPGCSTGAHLHFEVRRNNAWTDPAEFLTGKTVQDDQNGGTVSLGRGGWQWPLDDTIRLTQHYGVTPYSWRYRYSGGVHTGYDMVSSASIVIRAPADGTLYSSSQACGSSSIIKIKYIEHGDGIISFYLHVQ